MGFVPVVCKSTILANPNQIQIQLDCSNPNPNKIQDKFFSSNPNPDLNLLIQIQIHKSIQIQLTIF